MKRRVVFGVADKSGYVWNHTLTTSRYEARVTARNQARVFPKQKPWRVVRFVEEAGK